MKRTLLVFLAFSLGLTGCATIEAAPLPANTPIPASDTPTQTFTPEPTTTSTITPTPRQFRTP